MLSLNVHGKTAAENTILTAREYFRRGSELQAACWALQSRYTYEVIEIDPGKREMRMKLGKIAVEILEIMAAELFFAGAKLYAQNTNPSLTPRAIEVAEQTPQTNAEVVEGR